MIANSMQIGKTKVTAYRDGSVERDTPPRKFKRSFGCNSNGYKIIHVNGRKWRVHRLIAMAFLDDYSEELQVDHINGYKSDNRLSNLRMVTPQGNRRAKIISTRNEVSNYRGVCFDGQYKGNWKAQVTDGSTRINLGLHESEEDAARIYDAMALSLGFFPEALNFGVRDAQNLLLCAICVYNNS